MVSVLEVAFEPAVRIGDLLVRWQALVVAFGVLVALLVAAVRTRVERPFELDLEPLRLDDLMYVTLGAVPGAVLGARLVHALGFLDVYGSQPDVLLDIARGGFSLTGAVLGGVATGIYVASLLEGSARRWAEVAAVPMLLALAIGKVGQLLAGGGQGAFWDGPWAVAFGGDGPWLSPAPAVPAHPVALYEAAWYLVGIVVVAWGVGRLRDGAGVRDGGGIPVGAALLVAVCWFLAGRAVLGFFWRDDPLVGPLNAEQAIAIVSLGVVLAARWAVVLRQQGRQRAAERAGLVRPARRRGG